jgi:hypothetical protein
LIASRETHPVRTKTQSSGGESIAGRGRNNFVVDFTKTKLK